MGGGDGDLRPRRIATDMEASISLRAARVRQFIADRIDRLRNHVEDLPDLDSGPPPA
jgi:hypothetical protein